LQSDGTHVVNRWANLSVPANLHPLRSRPSINVDGNNAASGDVERNRAAIPERQSHRGNRVVTRYVGGAIRSDNQTVLVTRYVSTGETQRHQEKEMVKTHRAHGLR
jgi:hypothetical protein